MTTVIILTAPTTATVGVLFVIARIAGRGRRVSRASVIGR